MPLLSFPFLCALALPSFVGGACGDDAGPAQDAAMQGNDVLSVLNPPGDSIGLDFSGAATLRIQLTDADGGPIANQPVDFSIVQTGSESSGGASLSTSSQRTNTIGIAEVDLVAGAERVNFRVEASAPNATSAQFYIQVSDQGFSDARIYTAHEGPRDPQSYELVELRIFDDREVRCQDIDFEAPLESLYPPRTQALLGEDSEFRNLAIGLGYTIIAWARAGAEETVQATGCMQLPADRLRSGSNLEAVLPVVDTPYALPDALVLQTEITLAPLAETLSGADAWEALACPLGRAQLLLDCLTDAQAPDGNLDCDSQAPSELATALESARGTLVDGDCRAATRDDGGEGLESLLNSALSGWPSAAELDALITGRNTAFGTILIQSELSPVSPSTSRHRLLRADLGPLSTDLVASDRPVLSVSSVPLATSASPTLRIGLHGFTLRFADLAADAYETLGLAPANVSTLGQTLGSELLTGVEIGAGSGCDALESFVCEALMLPVTCADGCAAIAPELDILLGAWLPELASSSLDYQYSLEASTLDADQNLIIEALTADESGVSAQLTTQSSTITLPATTAGSLP